MASLRDPAGAASSVRLLQLRVAFRLCDINGHAQCVFSTGFSYLRGPDQERQWAGKLGVTWLKLLKGTSAMAGH